MGIDANKIGLMGFSAGAELVAPAAVFYESSIRPTTRRAIRCARSGRGPISPC